MSPEYELEFDLIRNRYYADFRYQFFNRLTKACVLLGLLLMWVGGYVVNCKFFSLIIECGGSLLLIVNVVFDFQSSAVFWKNMSDNYSNLYQNFLKKKKSLDSRTINDFNAQMLEISSKDKNYKRVLSEKAHNSTNHELGCAREYDFDIGWFKSITANIFSWESGNLRYIDMVK